MIPLAAVIPALVIAAQALLPPPDMTVTEWAETYRVLSREDSAAPGRFSCDERPYQRGIMDACSTPRIQYVTVVGSSQWGKTQVLNNIVGTRIHLNPGPIMVVCPTERAAEKWSKTRFAPMVRDCPELAARVGDGRSSSNTILEKQFPGGLLVGVGANAPAGLASQPIRDLLMDETDRIPEGASAGEEGDFEELAEARTADFEGRRLIYRCSTPTIKGHSRIEKSWGESDQRRWHITCPHCGHRQTLDFHNVVFQDRIEPVYGCAGGGCEITEPELRRAVLAGEWVATRPEITDHAGFHVHGLMVRPMSTLVKKFLKAKRKGRMALQVFVNTQLGEWWNLRDGDEIQVEGLLARARSESYAMGQIPAGVGVLVASLDVQSSPQRLEWMLYGVGSGHESWVIQHEIIPGNLLQAEAWDRVQALLLKAWPREDGAELHIRAQTGDIGGHFTKQMYAFARRPALRGLVHPVKGATRPQARLALRGKKARLWTIDTVTAKDWVFASLEMAKPGPGYLHLPNDIDQMLVEQILSEHMVRKENRRAYEVNEKGVRNEALDLLVYALAAVEIFAPRDLDALVAKAHVEPVTTPSPEDPPAPEPPSEPTIRRIRPPLRRGGGGGLTGFGGAF